MNRTTRTMIAVAAVVGTGLGTYGIAAAASNSAQQQPVDDDTNEANDTPLTGSDLDQAVAAALEHTGGGEVVETEVGDDGAAFGVEIVLDDGSQVEVNLDADFAVIGSEPDDD